MFETLIQFDKQSYPFDLCDDSENLKLETVVECKDSQAFLSCKHKLEAYKNISSPILINLTNIYKEALRLHLVFEYTANSLGYFIKQWNVRNVFTEGVQEKRELFQKIATGLFELTDVLSANRIEVRLEFKNFGVLLDQDENYTGIKYYIGPSFQFSQLAKEKLRSHYFSQRKRILTEVQKHMEFEKKTDYLPSFIMRGNKLIFTDELSQTKTRKKRDQSPEPEKEYSVNNNKNRFRQSRYEIPRNPRGERQKRHKYSCNYDYGQHNFEFDEGKTNRSFDDDKFQTFSVTQTKKMKIEVEHQKATQKCRKNSIKFKITTFEEISIDNDTEGQFEFDPNNFHFNAEPDNEPAHADKNPEEAPKDYKQKVKAAREKAEALISKYMKTKKQSPSYT